MVPDRLAQLGVGALAHHAEDDGDGRRGGEVWSRGLQEEGGQGEGWSEEEWEEEAEMHVEGCGGGRETARAFASGRRRVGCFGSTPEQGQVVM